LRKINDSKMKRIKLIYNKGLKIYIVNVFIEKSESKLYDNDKHIINNRNIHIYILFIIM
jgi:hypothetical protein